MSWFNEEQLWIEYYETLYSKQDNHNMRNEVSPCGRNGEYMLKYRRREIDFATGDTGTYIEGDVCPLK